MTWQTTIGVALAVALQCCPSSAADGSGTPRTDRQSVPAMNAAGVTVHILADNPERTCEWGANGRMIVHALSPDDSLTSKARALIAQRRLSGLVSVETRPALTKLPYASRLVNLLVVEDLKNATARGLSLEEVFRVVVPRGTVLVGGASRDEVRDLLTEKRLHSEAQQTDVSDGWVRIAASRPAWMGEWTHGRKHDAGQRGLAEDRYDPAGLGPDHLWIQWLDAEHRPRDHGSMTSLVCHKGRFVSISNAETLAWARDGFYWRALGGRDEQFVLSARDAYNGVVQWIRPWRGEGRAGRGGGDAKRQLVALGDLIYTIEDVQLTATDANDGSIRFAVPMPQPATVDDDLFCESGVVVIHQPEGNLHAFDAESGARRWEHRDTVRRVAVDQGRLFAAAGAKATQDGSPAVQGARLIRALALDSGKVLWTKSASDLGCGDAALTLSTAGKGQVMLLADNSKVLVLNGEDGSVAHTLDPAPISPDSACRAGDYILVRGRGGMQFFEAQSGKVVPLLTKVNPQGAGQWGCGPGSLSESAFLAALAPPPAKGSHPPGWHEFIGHQGVNIACYVGPVFANGLLYQPQQYCGCGHQMGKTTGLIATGTVVPIPPREAFLEPGPLEKGPAFGRTTESANEPDAWSAFRGNAQRSCAAPGDFTDAPTLLWTQSLAVQPTNSLLVTASWRGQHFHNLTISAPVVAQGKVFVALVDEHTVVALDAVTGKPSWRFTANGRIDSPPTIHDGLCLFGSRDGWVYCLHATDGALAWRRRITPVDDRIVVYGQLESRFPVPGSILIEGGKGYATAGLSGQMGIMFWEFDPRTGDSLSYRQLHREGCLNDVLLKGPDGGLFLNRKSVAHLTGTVPTKAGVPASPTHLHSPHTGILNTVRTQSPTIAQRGDLELAGLSARGWVWTDNRRFGFLVVKPRKPVAGPASAAGSGLHAVEAPAVFALDAGTRTNLEAASLLWQTPATNVTAMVATHNHLLAAGPDPGMLADLAPQPASPVQPQKLSWQAVMRGETPLAATNVSRRVPVPIEKFPPSADPLWEAKQIHGDWEPMRRDPLTVGGLFYVFDAATGRMTARVPLPAPAVQDGMAAAGGRAYLALTDGSVACLGRNR